MKLRFLLVLLSLSLMACGSSPKLDVAGYSVDQDINKGKSLASGGSVTIKEGYLELISRVNPAIKRQTNSPAGKKKLLDNLVEQELLFKESMKQGVQNDPLVKEKLAMFARVIIAQALVDKEIENQAKENYEKNKQTEYNQVKIAHIFFNTRPKPNKDPKTGKDIPATPADLDKAKQEAKKKAEEVSAKLKAGEAWEKLIEQSDDKFSQKNQGEIGFITKNDPRGERMDWRAMIDKAFTMKKGETTEVIPAKDGFHIVKLVEEATVKPYEEVEASIKFKLRTKVKMDILEKLNPGGKNSYEDEAIKQLSEKAAKNQDKEQEKEIHPMKMNHPQH